MKKFSILLSLLFLTLFFSCSNNEQNEISETSIDFNKFELIQQLKVINTTEDVTDLILNMGVSKIVVDKTGDILNYSNVSQKTFRLNGETIDMKNYSFLIKNNALYIKEYPEYGISLLNGYPYFISPIYTGPSDKIDDKITDIKLSLLLLYLNELTQDSSIKSNSKSTLNSKTQGCSFWNTYYVYSTGGSASVAQANLQEEVDDYSDFLSGCTEIGGSDTSCLWENHGCVSTQAYCCN